MRENGEAKGNPYKLGLVAQAAHDGEYFTGQIRSC